MMANNPKHGNYVDLEVLEAFNQQISNISEVLPPAVFPSLAGLKNHPTLKEIEIGNVREIFTIDLKSYDYLFRELLEDPDNRLHNTPEVVQALKNLGAAMSEKNDAPDGDSEIPSAYTYLGQFIDHDITLEAASNDIAHASFGSLFFEPIAPAELRKKLKNTRSGSLDLDSIYEGGKLKNGRFELGNVSYPAQRPPHKTDANDLPRKLNGSLTAEIGDPRNDENTVIAQLHVAFLKFHNAVMTKRGVDFSAAQKIVRQHYQWIVLHDFLVKICDPEIVDQILREGNKIYDPTDENFFIPIEFTAAAYRFGHSMVREVYHFNSLHTSTSLVHLFRFSGSGGDMGGYPSLPADWIIEWDQFLPFETGMPNKARRINTRLASVLENLAGPGTGGIFQFLAKRNLLRGYLLSLPTGQALARQVLGNSGVLSSDAILDNATEDEKVALQSAELHIKTPLWYYILAEASIQNGGMHLGKLGSTIVAETIIGLIRRSADSILKEMNWTPVLGEEFNLEQMIQYADLGPGQGEGY